MPWQRAIIQRTVWSAAHRRAELKTDTFCCGRCHVQICTLSHDCARELGELRRGQLRCLRA